MLSGYYVPVIIRGKYNNKNDSIPLLVPSVPDYKSIRRYLKQIDRNRIYTNFGPLNAQLISRISQYLNVPESHVQTAANATLALEGAIRTSEAQSENWELPSWTFAATAHAALNARTSPKFVDVSLNSWRAEFSDKTLNAIDVLPFGDDLDLGRIPHQVETLVIDGAASINALAGCGLPPTIRKTGFIVSMHATKSLPAGEGAFFVSNSEEWSRRFRAWTNFGFDSYRNSESSGTNAKLSEYSAAVALASLDLHFSMQSRLNELQETAKESCLLSNLQFHPAFTKGISTPYWIINFQSSEVKQRVKTCFTKNQISFRDWWGEGCHKHPAFSHINKKSLYVTDLLASQTLGLPFHTFMARDDFKRIAYFLKGCLLDSI